ncbi:MAG: restriction endonuclease subunit S [Prevotella sp.]|nr:restriction endonuclease subunit S [Prevotella sp.]MBR6988449.1 restriction endonuclease subunit S [Bacteroidaceae bacterium]
MERYREYKDSGVQWLGEIPGHWRHVALSKVSEIILGKMLQGETKNETDTLFPYICAKDVHFDGIDVSDLKTMYFSQSEMEQYGVLKGDMLIVEGGAGAGNCSILREEVKKTGIQNSIMIVRSNDDALNDYICYFMSSIVRKGYVDFITNVATIPHFTKEKVSRTNIPLPPLSEQHSIVSYLDDKCGKIDKMLEGKQKQIELLAEIKQRIIADAVTRGLNPDVKMKATNIPWLPEIPEHWEEQRMATLFTGDIEVNKDFEYKRAFKFNYGQLVSKNEIGEPEDYREVYVKYSKIKQGDILVNGLNLNYDFISQRVACAPSDGIITSAYVVCRPRKDVNYEYYTYLFKGMDSMKLFHGMGTGIRLTLSFKEMKKQILPIPPHSEQHDIVSYIKERSAKIDILTSKLQQEIESIKEYKQRLISDVVTGQIKVC